MKIGIIGAGNIGSALAGHFRKLQHITLIANSPGCRGYASMSATMRCCWMTRSVMSSGPLRSGWMPALTCGKECRTDFCPALVRWPPPIRRSMRSAGFWATG